MSESTNTSTSDGSLPLILAASTHAPEEKWVIESLQGILGVGARLLIAPRHPERFADVANLLRESDYTFVRRSERSNKNDKSADIILLDSIGELRAAYPLAEIVFVGGSLISHGGQNILEPAAAGCAIVSGWSTFNFERIVTEFSAQNALVRLEKTEQGKTAAKLRDVFTSLLTDKTNRERLGKSACEIVEEHRGAAVKTISHLKTLNLRNN